MTSPAEFDTPVVRLAKHVDEMGELLDHITALARVDAAARFYVESIGHRNEASALRLLEQAVVEEDS